MRNPPESPFQAVMLAPTWLGDSVMSTGLISPLRQFSGKPVEIWARSSWKVLFDNHPDVGRVLEFDPKGSHSGATGIRRWRELIRSHESAPDLVYVTPPSLSAAVAAWKSGVGFRIGARGQFRAPFLSRTASAVSPLSGHWIDQHLNIMAQCGLTGVNDDQGKPAVQPTNAHFKKADTILDESGASGDRTCIFIAGATYGPAKRWPHFAALGELLPADMAIVVTGSASEAPILTPLIDDLRRRGRRVLDLCGNIDIMPLAALFARARFTVANDTGTMHLAAAVGGRVLGLFTSTWPGWTAPRGDVTRWIHAGTSCSPCFKRDCPEGHYRCLDDVDPAAVLAELKPWLEDG